MAISKNKAVSIAYNVKTAEDGTLIDSATSSAPLEYLHGYQNLIPGLENALEGRKIGDKFSIDIQAENAYGEYNEQLVQRVPKDVFEGADHLEVGMRFLADTDMGPVPVQITDIDGDHVIVDGNHLLAGKDLSFDVEVIAVRDATEDEIAHGHLHSDNEEEEGGCCGGGHGGCGCGDKSDSDCCSNH